MKKYRPWKIHIIFLLIHVIDILGLFLLETEDYSNLPISQDALRVILILATIALTILWILISTSFVQFKEDRVILRLHDHASKNQFSFLKTQTILFKDIRSVGINYLQNFVMINLKNGSQHMYNFGAIFKTHEILEKFSKIQCGDNE